MKRNKKAFRKISLCIGIALVVIGAGLLLFPTVSNFIGTLIANSQAAAFDEKLENVINDGTSFSDALLSCEVDENNTLLEAVQGKNGEIESGTSVIFQPDLDRLYTDSVAYNEGLVGNQSELLTNDTYSAAALDLTDYGIFDGIYGYVTADTIGLKLPIYLGANSATMSWGAAHMCATSLPIGGESTNTVLAGHTGYIGRIFFDNLRNLQIGDTVSVPNFWTTLDYKVIKTEVCKPAETANVYIQKGKDLLTMFTCISDGNGGFDRYYVICERI